jgi:hypothetical protein
VSDTNTTNEKRGEEEKERSESPRLNPSNGANPKQFFFSLFHEGLDFHILNNGLDLFVTTLLLLCERVS